MAPKLGTATPPGYEQYFDYPASLFALNETQTIGLIPLGVIACIAFSATFISSAYIAWRLVYSALHPKEIPLYRNQLLLLIFNLLLSDMFQAMSFIFSFHWYGLGMILAPSSPCWTQAWFLHLGNVASGTFVLAIALHTWYKITRFGRSLSHKSFVFCLCGIWAFSLLLASLGPMIRGEDNFVRAGLWCWINVKYEDDRLSLHYIWIFIYECGTIVLYAFIWYKLYKHARECRDLNMHAAVRSRIERSQKFMAIYPVIYVIFTLPLAFGRMWSMAHDGTPLPDAYMIVAGCLIASCGWMDALMYTLTRGVFHTRANNGSANHYSRGATLGASGFPGSNITARDRIMGFDDLTALRSMDGDATPPEAVTTTIIAGGKDVDALDGNNMSHSSKPSQSKSARLLGIGRRTHGQSRGEVTFTPETTEEKEVKKPQKRQRGNPVPLSSISEALARNDPHMEYQPTRAQSPSDSDDTRVGSSGSMGGSSSPPFGQIKKETTIQTTSSLA